MNEALHSFIAAAQRSSASRTAELDTGRVCVNVVTDIGAGMHSSIRDVFIGDAVPPLSTSVQQGLRGNAPAPATASVTYSYATNLVSGATGSYSESSATVTPLKVTIPTNGTGKASAPQFIADRITAPYSNSPDYGVAYILANADPGAVPPMAPADIPWTTTFMVRVWKQASALLTYTSGNQQSTPINQGFAQPLCVTVSDSVGSTRATQGMTIRFDIAEGDAVFDTSANTNCYQAVTEKMAWVISQHGPAMCPPIKAGSNAGTIKVVASSNFAANSVAFILTATTA